MVGVGAAPGPAVDVGYGVKVGSSVVGFACAVLDICIVCNACIEAEIDEAVEDEWQKSVLYTAVPQVEPDFGSTTI